MARNDVNGVHSFGEFAYHESPYDATDREKRKDRRKVKQAMSVNVLSRSTLPRVSMRHSRYPKGIVPS